MISARLYRLTTPRLGISRVCSDEFRIREQCCGVTQIFGLGGIWLATRMGNDGQFAFMGELINRVPRRMVKAVGV